MNSLFAIKLSSEILQGLNISKLSENYIQKFVFVLSVALAGMGTILPVIKEIKMYNFKIQSGMCKRFNYCQKQSTPLNDGIDFTIASITDHVVFS